VGRLVGLSVARSYYRKGVFDDCRLTQCLAPQRCQEAFTTAFEAAPAAAITASIAVALQSVQIPHPSHPKITTFSLDVQLIRVFAAVLERMAVAALAALAAGRWWYPQLPHISYASLFDSK
jgi:hypothetical protein